MINVTVNLPEGKEVHHHIYGKQTVGEVMQSIRCLYPQWSSIVMVITRREVEENNERIPA
jgi:hypothetical protein